jgi:hypothetical protein
VSEARVAARRGSHTLKKEKHARLVLGAARCPRLMYLLDQQRAGLDALIVGVVDPLIFSVHDAPIGSALVQTVLRSWIVTVVKRECASHVHEVVDSEVALSKRVVTSDNDPITCVAFVLVEHIDLAVYEPECAQSKAAAAAAASSDELVAAQVHHKVRPTPTNPYFARFDAYFVRFGAYPVLRLTSTFSDTVTLQWHKADPKVSPCSTSQLKSRKNALTVKRAAYR